MRVRSRAFDADAHDVIAETNPPTARVLDQQTVLLADGQCSDARGGGVATSFKDATPGLGSTKRSTKRFAAQPLVLLLGSLAHNGIVWARQWVSDREPKVRRYGLKRMVRDIFHISGFLVRNACGPIITVVRNHRAPLVHGRARSLDGLLRPRHIAVNWGQI